MDSIMNATKQPQTTVHINQDKVVEHTAKTHATEKTTTEGLQKGLKNDESKIGSEKDVKNLVVDLNKAIEPLNTDVQFGVDSQNVFYVSVIDQKTDRMIRRFPAEQAQDFLPKMKEISGILFDAKG